MEKLINESAEVIKAKWKLRANLLKKAEEQKVKEHEDALNIAVAEYKTNFPAIAALEAQGEFIKDMVSENFIYTPSSEALARIKAFEDQAFSLLPKDIQVEMWGPDTCECKLKRICKTINGEYVCQTFSSEFCRAHEGLTLEEVHDAVEVENTSKNLVEGELNKIESISEEIVNPNADPELLGAGKSRPRKLKEGIKYNWSFTGSGKNRVLHVDVGGAELTKQTKDSIKLFTKEKFGEGKVNV